MNEDVLYDDELLRKLQDIPLPDEDFAWQDMNRRLNEDDVRNPIIPPLVKSCGCLVGLLLLMVTAVIFYWKGTDRYKNKQSADEGHVAKTKRDKYDRNRVDSAGIHKIDSGVAVSINKINDSVNNSFKKQKSKTASNQQHNDIVKMDGTKAKSSSIKKAVGNGKSDFDKKVDGTKKGLSKQNSLKDFSDKKMSSTPGKKIMVDTKVSKPTSVKEKESINNLTEDKGETVKSDAILDSVNISGRIITSTPKTDLPAKKSVDSILAKARTKIDEVKDHHIYFGAGVGLHQLIPVNGQKSNPYNSSGRKSSLGDYIPSVFLRMYKDDKWFLESAFRYGAPQYTKEVLFIQQKVADTSGVVRQANNSRVKKTFYHQIPVSFNFYVLPDLSVGTGLTFNKFTSALVQNEVVRPGGSTQPDSIISSMLVSKRKADSNFVNSYLQLILQANFKWKRFSTGLKYSFGLQPYLQFQLPGGEQKKEKNSSFQFVIRYELWRSGSRK